MDNASKELVEKIIYDVCRRAHQDDLKDYNGSYVEMCRVAVDSLRSGENGAEYQNLYTQQQFNNIPGTQTAQNTGEQTQTPPVDYSGQRPTQVISNEGDMIPNENPQDTQDSGRDDSDWDAGDELGSKKLPLPEGKWDTPEAEKILKNNYLYELQNTIVGKPYVLGGGNINSCKDSKYPSTKDENGNYIGFDCCGGIMHALRESTGLNINERNVAGIRSANWSEPIRKDQLQAGDIIVIDRNNGGAEDHVVSVYEENGKRYVITTSGNENGGETVNNVLLEGYLKSLKKQNCTVYPLRINFEKLKKDIKK